jgi:hypothetical protein
MHAQHILYVPAVCVFMCACVVCIERQMLTLSLSRCVACPACSSNENSANGHTTTPWILQVESESQNFLSGQWSLVNAPRLYVHVMSFSHVMRLLALPLVYASKWDLFFRLFDMEGWPVCSMNDLEINLACFLQLVYVCTYYFPLQNMV